MKSITSRSSFRQLYRALLVWGALCVTGCGVTHQRPPASDTAIASAASEIRSTRAVGTRTVSWAEAYNKAYSLLNRIRPAAEQQCLKLGERSSKRCDDWTVRVADLDEINAGAGGRQDIILNRGVFELAQNDDEVALVMAHEMSHHMLNHIRETNVSGFTGSVLGSLVGGIVAYGLASLLGVECDPAYQDCSYIGDFAGPIIKDGAEIGREAMQLKFSRAQEHEADLMAAYIVHSAGYDLMKARSFVLQMSKVNPDTHAKSSFGDTHPSGPERLAQFDLSMREVSGASGQQSRLTNIQLVRVTGTAVEGCTSGNCVNGFGTQTWPGGSQYVGEFKDGERHGQGTLTYIDGFVLPGRWENNRFLGPQGGTSENQTTSVRIEGCTSGNCVDGRGAFIWPDGTTYVGEWRDDKKHGRGTSIFADGRKYVGKWEDGQRHGQGTYTSADGDQYVGEFEDDKYHGHGTFTWANGNQYVGEWRGGERTGQRGRWTNGEFLGPRE